MISFKTFLLEFPSRLEWDKNHAKADTAKWRNLFAGKKTARLIDKWGNNKIYKSAFEQMFVLTDADNNILITVSYYSDHQPKWVRISTLKSSTTNTVKAHKFYARLIDLGYILISGDEQTKGGELVWYRLSQEPGVEVKRASEDYVTGYKLLKPLYSRWRDHYSRRGEDSLFVAYKKGTNVDDFKL